MAGQVVPGGIPENPPGPLDGIFNGAGIHGTDDTGLAGLCRIPWLCA
jgi:hypothetical protein